MNIEHWIIIYLVCNSAVLSFMIARDEDVKEWYMVALSCIAAIPMLAFVFVLDAIPPLQLKTFWRFLFNRKRLVTSEEHLDRLNHVSTHYRNSESLEDRIWRAAVRCYNKVNNYTPPKP